MRELALIIALLIALSKYYLLALGYSARNHRRPLTIFHALWLSLSGYKLETVPLPIPRTCYPASVGCNSRRRGLDFTT